MTPNFVYKSEKRLKTNISASDAGKLGIDIILGLNNVAPTNPMEWGTYLRFGAGKGTELEMMKILKQNGIVDEDYDQDFEIKYGIDGADDEKVERDSTKIERQGVTISMRFDAEVKKGGCVMKADDSFLPQGVDIEMKEGEPIEIKTINNANKFDIQKYIDNSPRDNYVQQLAIYMDALGKDQGHLFVADLAGLNKFWFVCKKTAEGIYQCGNTIVDLNKEYARFAELKEASKNIWNYPAMKKYWEEEVYKTPIDKIDWTKISTTKIGDARNGRYVVGSEGKYKIDYSPYKKAIIHMQGASLGYSPEENEAIKTSTAGFSAKPKVEKKVEEVK